jgi:hypothetical protein
MVAVHARWQSGAMKSISPSLPVLAPEVQVFYVESSLPPGLTLNEYRRGRARRTSRWGRLKRLAGAGAAPAAA